MRKHSLPSTLLPGVLTSLLVPAAIASVTVDFEDLAVGTVVTTQYDGVTFSALPQSCGGAPPVNVVIVNPEGGTASGTRGLSLTTGCPDFSPDYLRMVFDDLQREVTFTLGDYAGGTMQVKSYRDNGTLIATQNIVLEGDNPIGCFRLVRVGSASGPYEIRRIQIDNTLDLFEVIDDLTFDSDTTPPTASITSPAYRACGCGTITVRGIACDDDGDYGFDKLEYMPVAGGAWVQIGTYSSPVCVEGNLYTWNTAAIADGEYFLLLTVENANGLQAQDLTVVYVDKTQPGVTLTTPTNGAIVGGTVCFHGTVTDRCFDHFTVDYRPAGGGAWQPVDAPQYNSQIYNPVTFATWNTTLVADGSYELRVVAYDSCNNTRTVSVTVTVDNTDPVATLTAPLACKHLTGGIEIRGSATDLHFGQWTLHYVGGAASDWQPIANGGAPVNNGLFVNWNTAGLQRCAYTIRLVVTDTAQENCCGGQPNRREFYRSISLGPLGDINCDGVVDFNDINPFVDCLAGGCDCP